MFFHAGVRFLSLASQERVHIEWDGGMMSVRRRRNPFEETSSRSPKRLDAEHGC